MMLPVVDSFLPETEQYLPRDPKDVLETGNYVKMPVLTGTARHEGAVTLCEYRCALYMNKPYYIVMLCYVMSCYVVTLCCYIILYYLLHRVSK
jgi:hypothetical protein